MGVTELARLAVYEVPFGLIFSVSYFLDAMKESAKKKSLPLPLSRGRNRRLLIGQWSCRSISRRQTGDHGRCRMANPRVLW